MGKKALFFCIFVVCFGSVVWAGGRKENIARSAGDPSGFTDPIDISGKKTGKYNYLLEAKDKAGNIGPAGPENIFIDPESDLPRVTIVNPMSNMHVQGNLNIVGIASDDDGISYVELKVNRGRDGKGEELINTRARGGDFWSFLLDTTNPEIWTDGEYTITAWATDINGLSGISGDFKPKQHKIHQVFWNLDRKKPEIAVTSHEIGALAAGKVRLKGTAFDGNGISVLNYSVDEGQNYSPLSPKYDKKNNIYTWDVEIDTKKFEDGPALIWLKARDGMGTVGTTAHLLFANNTNPEVSIEYPDPSDAVYGVFTVAGYASHAVGLKSLTWKAGKDSGEFPLVIGNPWWSLDIDLRNQKLSSIDVEIRAEDVLGKVTVAKQKYKVDPNAGMPRVTLQEPASGVIVGEDGNLVVKGVAKAGDGVASVVYSLNAGPEVEIPCLGYFQFVVPEISGGTHTLDVWAKDVSGVAGPKVQVKGIVVPGALPEPRLTIITVPSVKPPAAPFYSGMSIRPEPKMTVEVFIKSAAPLKSASVAFGDFPAVAVKPTAAKEGFRVTVPVPLGLAEGLTKIELRATDRFDRETVYNEYVYVTADVYNPPSGPFVWAAQKTMPDGRMILGSADEILVGMNGAPLASAAIRGTGAENFTVEVDGYGRVILRALREGSFGPLTLALQDRFGGSSNSASFRVLANFSGPVISLRDVPQGRLVQNSIPVRLGVSGAAAVRTAEYSLDMGSSWQALSGGADISRTLDISPAEDGAITVLIRATDETDRVSTANFSVLKKTVPSEAKLIVPISGARVNGIVRLGFFVQGANTLKSVTYNRPAVGGQRAITREVFNVERWEKDYAPKFLDVLTDPIEMPLDTNMRFVFEDMAGNSATLNAWDFIIDNEMDIPVVHVTMPLEDEVITSDFIVSGVAFDDDAIARISWSMDNGPQQVVEAAYGFSIPVALSRLTDNEHYISIIAEDIYGVRTPPVRRNFRVSLAEPVGAVTAPVIEAVLKDEVEIRGTASDRNGIDQIKVSLDNGNTYNAATGTESWNYRFNSKILKDGPHAVFIRVWDKYGVSAMYSTMINIDNTPPEVVLDSPGDASITTGIVTIMGRSIDPNLETVNVELRSLQGTAINAELRTRRITANPAFNDAFDISRQPDGLYNLELVARDKAGNITRVSRNIELARQTLRNYVQILYPLNNEEVQGSFNLYGYAGGTNSPGTVTLRVNGTDRVTNEVDDFGYFRFPLEAEDLVSGTNIVMVHSSFGGAGTVQSQAQNIVYKASGPWITIDSFSYGDFAFERPYLSGRTGYVLSEEDLEILASKTASKAAKADVKAKVPGLTEISFDNGKTFLKTDKSASKKIDYRYRLETSLMTEGMHYILVRTTMKNGDVAVTRMLVQVDKTPPVIRLISPETGGEYNQEIMYSASATDDVELVSLTYHLRKGDKAMYGVPGFLQGLYFESTIPPFVRQIWKEAPAIFAGGATYLDIGMGLSFFDDNVKIQGLYGYMTQENYESLGGDQPVRYGGQVVGIKLLASIYNLPFGSFAGPDWEWLSASLAVGANFSLFNVFNDENPSYPGQYYTQSEKPTWMSALIAQVEFPKITIHKWKVFRRLSLFTEGQLWFVPTDVNADKLGIKTMIPHMIVGVRLYVF